MVQPSGVDSFGYGPVLLSDPRLRGPSGFGARSVLEARRIFSALGPTGFVSGHFLHGTVPRQPPAAPDPTTRPLLRAVLRQVHHSAAGRHGARPWTGSSFHKQKEEGLESVVTVRDVFHTSKDSFSKHLKCLFNAFHGYSCG